MMMKTVMKMMMMTTMNLARRDMNLEVEGNTAAIQVSMHDLLETKVSTVTRLTATMATMSWCVYEAIVPVWLESILYSMI